MDRYGFLYGTVGKDYKIIAQSSGLEQFVTGKLAGRNAIQILDYVLKNVGDFKLDISASSEYTAQEERPVNIRYSPMYINKKEKFAENMYPFAAICVSGLEPGAVIGVQEKREKYYKYVNLISKPEFCSGNNGYTYLDHIFGTKFMSYADMDELKKGNGVFNINDVCPQKIAPYEVSKEVLDKDWSIVSLAVTALYKSINHRVIIRLKPDDNIHRRGIELLKKIYSILPPLMAFETGFSLYEKADKIVDLAKELNTRIFVVSGGTELVQDKLPAASVVIDLGKDIPKNPDLEFEQSLLYWASKTWNERYQCLQAAITDQSMYFQREYFLMATKDFQSNAVFSYIKKESPLTNEQDSISFVTSLIKLYNDYFKKYRPAINAECVNELYKGRFEKNLPSFSGVPDELKKSLGKDYSSITGLKYRLYSIYKQFSDSEDVNLQANAPQIELLYKWISSLWRNPVENRAVEDQVIIANLDKDNAKRIATLEKEKADNQTEYEKEKALLQAGFEESKNQLVIDHSKEIDKLKKAAEKAEEDHKNKVEVLAEEHKTAVERLNEGHRAAIDTLLQNHKVEVDNLNEGHKTEVDNLKRDHQTKVENLQASHKDEVDKLNNIHNESLENVRSTCNSEIKKLQEKHKAEISELESKHKADLEISSVKLNDADNRIKELTSLAGKDRFKMKEDLEKVNKELEKLQEQNKSLQNDNDAKYQENSGKLKTLKIALIAAMVLALGAGVGSIVLGSNATKAKKELSTIETIVAEKDEQISEKDKKINALTDAKEKSDRELSKFNTPTMITGQPQSVSANNGETVTLSVDVSDKNVFFVWQKKTEKGNWKTIRSNGNSKLVFELDENNDGAAFRCIVISMEGITEFSDPAIVTISKEETLDSSDESMERGDEETLNASEESTEENSGETTPAEGSSEESADVVDDLDGRPQKG